MKQKGFAHLILLILLVIGIGIGIYLVKNPAIFKPKASENITARSNSATAPTLAFVFFGESNSGGIASNEDATAEERAPTSSVQILNNTSFNFEDLHIGFNNLIDHDGLPGASSIDHGLELQLANSVKTHAFANNPQVYLVKTGQGMSVVDSWLTDYRGYWSKFLERISYAKAKMPPGPVQWVVWYSLGINNRIAGAYSTPVDIYKSKTIEIIHNIKAQLPGAIIIMTQFQAQDALTEPGYVFDFASYNEALAQIAASEPNVYVVDTTGSTLRPDAPMHWDYAGFKTVGSRMVDITNNALQTVNTLTAAPNPCILNISGLCTSKLTWNFPSVSDLKIIVRENAGSTLSYQIGSGSVDVPWISASGATFDAYSGDTLLRSLFVTGVNSGSTPTTVPTPTTTPSPVGHSGTISADPNPCKITSGETCSSTINWNFPIGSDVKIKIKESPESLFATGVNGSQTADWIRAGGATFQAYVNGNLSQEVFVKGVSSPSSKVGDLNNDGSVDALDYGLFIQDYFTNNLRSDLNKNGSVDIFDYNILYGNFGK